MSGLVGGGEAVGAVFSAVTLFSTILFTASYARSVRCGSSGISSMGRLCRPASNGRMILRSSTDTDLFFR